MADPSDPGPWWAVILGGVPGAASAGWVAWQWFANRNDTNKQRDQTATLTVQQQMQADALAMSKRIDERTELADRRIAQEMTELRAQAKELALDRDKGWNLARYWYWEQRQIGHEMRDAQQLALSLAYQMQRKGIWPEGQPLPEQPDTSRNYVGDPEADARMKPTTPAP